MFSPESIKAGVLSALYQLTQGKIDLNNRFEITNGHLIEGVYNYQTFFDGSDCGVFFFDPEIEDFDSYHLEQFHNFADRIVTFRLEDTAP